MVGEGVYSVGTAVPDIIIAYYTVPAVDGVCVASGVSVRGKPNNSVHCGCLVIRSVHKPASQQWG